MAGGCNRRVPAVSDGNSSGPSGRGDGGWDFRRCFVRGRLFDAIGQFVRLLDSGGRRAHHAGLRPTHFLTLQPLGLRRFPLFAAP